MILVYPEDISSPAFRPHSGPQSRVADDLPADVVREVKAAGCSWGSLIFLLASTDQSLLSSPSSH